jgi:hypothetical protein
MSQDTSIFSSLLVLLRRIQNVRITKFYERLQYPCHQYSLNYSSINRYAALNIPKIKEASTYLEETIQNSHYGDLSAHHEATARKQLAHNLGHNLELAISEVRERRASLQAIPSSKSTISRTLSTTDDLSVVIGLLLNLCLKDFQLSCLRIMFKMWTFAKKFGIVTTLIAIWSNY